MIILVVYVDVYYKSYYFLISYIKFSKIIIKIWVYELKALLMVKLNKEKIKNIIINMILLLNYFCIASIFRNVKDLNTALVIFLTNLLKVALALFKCYLVLFQLIDGFYSMFFNIKSYS